MSGRTLSRIASHLRAGTAEIRASRNPRTREALIPLCHASVPPLRAAACQMDNQMEVIILVGGLAATVVIVLIARRLEQRRRRSTGDWRLIIAPDEQLRDC
jgi:hypothetical protein